MKPIAGIYKIICVENNREYIGLSKNIEKRIKKHLADMRLGTHPKNKMVEDYAKYGEHAFIYTIIRRQKKSENYLGAHESCLIKESIKKGTNYNTLEKSGRKANPLTIKGAGIGFVLEHHYADIFAKICKDRGVNKSAMVRQIILDWMKKHG
jgi:group I intron endonuclease